MTSHSKRHGRRLVIALLAMVLWSIALLWAWNTLAVDLFGLPEMQFKHGFASMLIIAVAASAVPITRRIISDGYKD